MTSQIPDPKARRRRRSGTPTHAPVTTMQWACDHAGRFVWANPELAALCGTPPSSIVGRSWDEFPHLSCAEELAAETHQLLNEGSDAKSLSRLHIVMEPTPTAIAVKLDRADPDDAPEIAIRGSAMELGPEGLHLALPQIAAQRFEDKHGTAYLAAVVEIVARVLKFDVVYAGRLMADKTTIWVEAGWRNGTPCAPFSYDVSITPCRNVVGRESLVIPDGAADRYPEDPPLRKNGIRAYVGVPLWGGSGEALGLLACLAKNKLENPTLTARSIEWFARRVAAEMEWSVFNGRLEEQDRQQRAHQDALVRVLRETSSENSEEAFSRFVTIAGETLGVQRASLWRLEAGGARLRCVALWRNGAIADDIDVVIHRKDNPRYFDALASSRIINAGDARTHPATRGFLQSYLAPLDIRSMLDASIEIQGVCAGAVCLETVAAPRNWTSLEEAFALGVADIAALRLTEIQLREAQLAQFNQLAILTEAQRVGRMGSWTMRSDQDVNELSDEVFALLAIKPTPDLTIPRSRFDEAIHPDDLPLYVQARDKAIATGVAMEVEVRIPRSDGEIRWVKLTGRAKHDMDGVQLFGVMQDVTELVGTKHALLSLNAELESRVETRTDELRRAQGALREILDAIPVGVVVYDAQDILVYRNSGIRSQRTSIVPGAPGSTTRREGGRRLLEATGHLTGLSEAEAEKRVEEWNLRVYETGSVVEELVWLDGRISRYEARLLPNGSVVIVHIDISSLKRAQAELEAQNLKLQSEIARRERAEEEIRAAESRLREIIDAVPVGIVVYDPNGLIIVRNRKVNEIFPLSDPSSAVGITRRETVRRLVLDRADGKAMSADALEAEIDELIRRRDEKRDAGQEYISRGGLTVIDSQVKLADGTLISITLDVTDLRRAEFRMRELFRLLPVGVAITDKSGVTREINDRLRQIHPAASNWIGSRVSDNIAKGHGKYFVGGKQIADGPDRDRLIAARARAVLDPTLPPPGPVTVLNPSGRWVVVVSARTPDGSLIQVHQDVTDELESERRLQRIIESVLAGICLIGPTGLILDYNSQMSLFFPEMKPEIAIETPASRWIQLPGLHQEILEGRVSGAVEEETFLHNGTGHSPLDENVALTMKTPSGLSAQVTITRSADGYLVMSLTDLTEIERTQEALALNDRMAALGGLVAGVAHEINTPVGVAVTAASHLESATQEVLGSVRSGALTRSKLEKYLSVAEEGAQLILKNLVRAADLVSSFKRVSVDQTSDQRRAFNFHQLLNDIIATLRPQLRNTRVTVTLNCPEALVIEGYPGAVTQIVTNFVMNSLMHAFPEGTSGAIGISIEETDGELHLIYQDDGIGVSEPDLKKLFEPFFTTKRGQGGSGLGLSVVYNLVTQKLGGSIDVHAEPGLQFRIRLPHPTGKPEPNLSRGLQ